MKQKSAVQALSYMFSHCTTSGCGAVSNGMEQDDQTPKVSTQVGQSHTLPPLQPLDVSFSWLTLQLQQLPQHKKKRKKCEMAG